MVPQAVADPHPGPGSVVVAVREVGVCGSELSAYLGHNELRRPPLVMGHEFAGVVVEAAADVDASWVGQTVTVNPLLTCQQCRWCRAGLRQLCRERRIIGIDVPGAFADRVVVPESALWTLAASRLGALVEPLACAVRATGQAGIELGDVVVVYGAGIIGLMAAWMARRRGASTVWLVDSNPVRLAQGPVWGASRLFQPGGDSSAHGVLQAAPEGVDRVIDAVGLNITRAEGAQLVRRGGRMVLVGLHEPQAALPGNRLVRDEVEVVGSFCYRDQDFTVARDLVQSGALPAPEGWLDVRPLAAGDEAFREQAVGAAPFAKIVLEPNAAAVWA
jgi:threonine dehydrogenase-like Zn-dependent dehydrogenase